MTIDSRFTLRYVAGAICAIVIAVAVIAITLPKTLTDAPLPPTAPRVAEKKASPSLYCLFSDFTHASVVVGFYFAVALPKGAPPRFAERAEAVRNDPAINFEPDAQPIWSYATDEDGTPTIASPDGATRILLYGLKLGTADPTWIEAGIRSNIFRNLDGKCLQAHLEKEAASATLP